MAAWPLEIEPPAARGRRWRWRRSTTRGSRRCRARSTWRRSRLQKPKLALATACGHGHVPGVRGVPGVPGHGCRRLRGASVPRWASCRARHLPAYTQVEERVRFILHQKLGKPQHDSQNTTTTPASPARARVEERPDHKRGPITTERPGAKGPGAKGPGAMGPGAKGPGAERSGAERPGAEGPGGCTAGRPAGEAWTVVQRRPRRLVSQRRDV